MQDIISFVQSYPIIVAAPIVAIVAGYFVFKNTGATTAASPKPTVSGTPSTSGKPPVAMPSSAVPPVKKDEPDAKPESKEPQPMSGAKQIEPEVKPTPVLSVDDNWKTEPHNVNSSVLSSAANALQAAKDIHTPDAPDHIKEASKALATAATKSLEVVAPAVKAAVDAHTPPATKDEAPKSDGKLRMTADEWVGTLNKASQPKQEGEQKKD
jgi:hypothetical protein